MKEQKTEGGNASLVYILGGIIGGLAGVFAAKILLERARDENREGLLSIREGAQLGAMLLGLIRGISKLNGK